MSVHEKTAATVEGDFNDYPADLYLGAKDLRGTHMEDSAVGMVQAQRFALFRQATTKIRDMAQAVESVRAFDRTGHAGEALGHLEATFKSVKRVVTQLVEDIEASEDSYVEELRVRCGEHGTKRADAAAEPTPQAPAAPATDSSPASPLAGEENTGAVVTPNTAAPARTCVVAEGELRVKGTVIAQQVPKPGPGPMNIFFNQTANPVDVATALAAAHRDHKAGY